jgi:hypothetical protein
VGSVSTFDSTGATSLTGVPPSMVQGNGIRYFCLPTDSSSSYRIHFAQNVVANDGILKSMYRTLRDISKQLSPQNTTTFSRGTNNLSDVFRCFTIELGDLPRECYLCGWSRNPRYFVGLFTILVCRLSTSTASCLLIYRFQ